MKGFAHHGRALMLAAAMAVVAVPLTAYAQFGALGNFAKGKALEVLNDKVMEGLEKKFADIVAKEPISEAAKAAAVKKLTEIARPIVKRFIDGAAAGRLPNPAELVNTVMKDILPRIPEVVAASKAEGGWVAEQGGQTYEAGQAQPAQPAQVSQAQPVQAAQAQQTQEKPKIAAYVFGAEIPEVNKAMTSRLNAALSNSGRYMAIDDYKDFFLHADAEPKSGSASANAESIRILGKSFGADYVCVTEILSIMGENQVSARIISVETGATAAVAVVESPLKALADVADACERIVSEMFKNAPPLVVAAAPPPPVYAPPPQIIATYPEVQPGYQTNPYGYPQQQGAVENFTGGERFGTWALNTVIPGLGSASIMRDWTGFGTQIALGALGSTLLGLGVADAEVLAVIGGVALGANVTYNIVRSATYRKPGSVPREKVRRIDYYLSPKYQLPVGTPVSWGGANLEGGLVWGNGAFFGLDLNFGLSSDDDSYGYYDGYRYYGFLIGGGLSLGNVVDLGNSLQFVYGMSAGFWYLENEENWKRSVWHEGYYHGYYNDGYYTVSVNFLAPFVKLRWSFLEVTYRGLLGIDTRDGSFGWNNHQLMLGFYFATSKRERSR